jgi:transcriptional regulator with XRE-family HTH domain
MLSQAQRTTILELNAKGVTLREIARVMKLSRWAVRKILRSNSTQAPEIQRAEKAARGVLASSYNPLALASLRLAEREILDEVPLRKPEVLLVDRTYMPSIPFDVNAGRVIVYDLDDWGRPESCIDELVSIIASIVRSWWRLDF